MRVALISTPFLPVPPQRYGGTELIVYELCAGLRALGHEVVLYTVGESKIPCAPRSAPGFAVRCLYHEAIWPPDVYHELNHVAFSIADLHAHSPPVDVIHSHCPTSLAFARFAPAPVVYTIHHHRSELLSAYYAEQRDVCFVAISDRQRQLMPELGGEGAPIACVHHGLDPARYPLGPGGPAAAFLGRMSHEKAPHVAIEVALAAGVRLRMAGVPHAGDEPYYRCRVEPLLAAHRREIECVGEVNLRQKLPLLGESMALLFPIDWEEPFGLVMIEAMLCGTPVLGTRRGAVPEVVDEGVTGYVCSDDQEMAARLRELARGGFDRARCRARAVERFGRDRMVRNYLDVYERVIRTMDRDALSGAHSDDESRIPEAPLDPLDAPPSAPDDAR